MASRNWIVACSCLILAGGLFWNSKARPAPELSDEKPSAIETQVVAGACELIGGHVGGSREYILWDTGKPGRRKVLASSASQTLTIRTQEPESVGAPLEEVYPVSFNPDFVTGSWNDFLVGGWIKSATGSEFVLERWQLAPVQGAFEGDLPKGKAPAIGKPLALSWPSASWHGPYLDPKLRKVREAPRRSEVLRGGILSAESMVLDGWMRFILIASRADGVVHRVLLSEMPTLESFVTSADVPWLGHPGVLPWLVGTCPKDGSARFCLTPVHDTDEFHHDYIISDMDNDGNHDSIDEVASEQGWQVLFPYDQVIFPFSVHR